MIAVCWHFAYGVWLFAAKWGITPGETARRRFGYVCVALGVAPCGDGNRQHLGVYRREVPECAGESAVSADGNTTVDLPRLPYLWVRSRVAREKLLSRQTSWHHPESSWLVGAWRGWRRLSRLPRRVGRWICSHCAGEALALGVRAGRH